MDTNTILLADVTGWEVGTWIITTALGIIGLAIAYGKRTDVNVKNRLKVDDDPPLKIEKVSKRYNHDAAEQRFTRIEDRLDSHDAELDRVWQNSQVIEKDQAKRHLENSVALAKIMTKLGIKDANDQQTL